MNETDLEKFERHRPLMFSIAYRMLGSVSEAEDALQEAYLRYAGTPREEIRSSRAFLSTVVTRLCLNQLDSAHSRREAYLGPWLPEPVLTAAGNSADAPRRTELHESLSMAFLVLLEQLTPFERAVFLLRQVFEYEYAEIAEMIGKDEAACRQLSSRARKHISENRPRFKADPEAHREMLERFTAAVGEGELDGLLQLLSEDVTLWADGGGKARGAALEPLRGPKAVARFVIASPRLAAGPLESRIAMVNGEPSLLLRSQGQTRLVVMIGVQGGRVREVRIFGNPDKLKGVNV